MQVIGSDKVRIVVGLGVTGLSCARFLAAQGLTFSVVDSRLQPPGLDELKAEFPDIPVKLGAFDEKEFCKASELIVSPGVSLREPAIAAAQAAGVSISGDIELFCQNARAPIAAITGSNGKSTVTTLLGEMARSAGVRVAVGGNLGTPALSLLSSDVELYVLELSSFQLERCQALNAEVATVLNVSEDHIDHHGSLVAYHQAKHRIFRGVKQAVINRDDPLSQPLVPESVKCWRFGKNKPGLREFGLLETDDGMHLAFDRQPLLAVAELKVTGTHNWTNALAALAMGHALGLPWEAMMEALRAFPGLPHRCQYVAAFDDVRYYDDSKGTNVGAAVAALEGLAEMHGKVVLIAGGQSKGASFEPLMKSLLQCGRAAVFIGESAEQLKQLLDNRLPVELASSMPDAINRARSLARPGDAVLLSPACASFDMFKDYRHRGEVFQSAVRDLQEGGGVKC